MATETSDASSLIEVSIKLPQEQFALIESKADAADMTTEHVISLLVGLGLLQLGARHD